MNEIIKRKETLHLLRASLKSGNARHLLWGKRFALTDTDNDNVCWRSHSVARINIIESVISASWWKDKQRVLLIMSLILYQLLSGFVQPSRTLLSETDQINNKCQALGMKWNLFLNKTLYYRNQIPIDWPTDTCHEILRKHIDKSAGNWFPYVSLSVLSEFPRSLSIWSYENQYLIKFSLSVSSYRPLWKMLMWHRNRSRWTFHSRSRSWMSHRYAI